MPMTSESLASALDTWATAHFKDAVASAQKFDAPEREAAISRAREHLLACRESARQQALDFIRSHGGVVADDYGLPCRALALTVAEGNA